MTRVSRTLWHLVPPVLLTIALALGGLFAARALVPEEMIAATNDLVGNYLQTLGTIYAVLLAFVVFTVWTQYNEARTQVEHEANELLDLYRTAKGLPKESRERICHHLCRYLDAVIEREWPAMARSDAATSDEVWRILDDLWEAIRACEPRTETQRAIFDEVLARFNDLSDARTLRLGSNTLRIPVALKVLLYVGAVSTIGSMYLFSVNSAALHAILVGVLAGAISHVLYIIHDLDDCFGGDWQVTTASLERVRRYTRLGDDEAAQRRTA